MGTAIVPRCDSRNSIRRGPGQWIRNGYPEAFVDWIFAMSAESVIPTR